MSKRGFFKPTKRKAKHTRSPISGGRYRNVKRKLIKPVKKGGN